MIDGTEYLEEIKKLETIINNRLNDAEHWMGVAFRITSVLTPDKVQSSGSQQKMAEAVEKCLDIAREICESIDNLHKEKSKRISKIEQLKTTEYDVLHKIYVEYDKYPNYDKIAEVYKKSNAWVSTQHTNGIKHLETLLNESE